MSYKIQARETGTLIDEFETLEEAERTMVAYLLEDFTDSGVLYEQNFYEIVEIK